MADLIRLLINSFKTLLIAGVVGASAGLLATWIIHPRWTATMAIQIGQVTIPAPGDGSPAPQPIENQLTATERYNLPSSRLQVIGELGLPAPDSGNRDANLIFNSLKATAGRSPNVINVQVSAYSREGASAALDAALKTFSATHRKLFEQAINVMQSNLANVQAKLASAQQDYDRIDRVLKAATSSENGGGGSARDILASNTAALLNTQILTLRQQVTAYQDALGPLRSYPTAAMGSAYVPVESSTPGVALFVVAGAVLGLIIGAGLILLKETPQNPTVQN